MIVNFLTALTHLTLSNILNTTSNRLEMLWSISEYLMSINQIKCHTLYIICDLVEKNKSINLIKFKYV